MFKHYLTSAWRHLLQPTLTTSINELRYCAMNKSTRIMLAALLALASAPSTANTANIDAELQALTRSFDAARYDVPSGDARMKAMEAVRLQAAALETKYPKRAEPLLWQAWALDTQAYIDQSFSALTWIKQARKKLEAAIAIDPTVDGADAYALLGGLYAQIPGFPISFGNTKKGQEYLLKALAINPTGAQANLGYARYHRKMGAHAEVVKYASAVLRAPPRPGREKADADLRAQAEEMIAQAKAQLK
jgi:tetratricopeptide (TPR) repeat protein